MSNQAYIKEITRTEIIEHPKVSLAEANHWMEQVSESGYLKLKESEGIKFEIVEKGDRN